MNGDRTHRLVGALVASVAAVAAAACAPASDDRPALPPAGEGLDYQLGGAYDPGADVAVVARDRTERPAPDRYSICYVNGFQTQPGEAGSWLAEHRDVLLRDAAGALVTDPEWPDEYVLDVSTAPNRDVLLGIVAPWIDGCAADGFDAVEIDNLDTYTRFAGLAADDAVAFAAELARHAHAAGLAIAQKNAAELVSRRGEVGFDFAVVEQCNEYDECGVFTEAYGTQVYVIEYDRRAFERGCRQFPDLSIVLRDVALVASGMPGHVRSAC